MTLTIKVNTNCACGKPSGTEHLCWACHDDGSACDWCDATKQRCAWCPTFPATIYVKLDATSSVLVCLDCAEH